jgi:hypothetical protein
MSDLDFDQHELARERLLYALEYGTPRTARSPRGMRTAWSARPCSGASSASARTTVRGVSRRYASGTAAPTRQP